MNIKVPCPAGSYCINGKEYTCYAGYLCISGSKTPTPTDGSTGEACERGHYCEEGAEESTPCPIGTYNSFEGASTEDSCLPCPVNTECPEEGSAFYSVVECPAGFYCDSDDSVDPDG